MSLKMRSIWIFAGIALISGCGKDSLLFYQPPKAPLEKVQLTHKVKDLSGDSEVDILWVIDNSGSMGVHQQNVILNAEKFMNQFTQNKVLKWRMGLISTDQGEPPYLGLDSSKPFDYQSPNPIQAFQSAVAQLGTSGDSTERMFSPVKRALGTYPNFIRPSALLAIIVVTDAPEQSGVPDPNGFLADLVQIKGAISRVVIYGVLGAMDFGCEATDDPWNYKGSRYEGVIQPTNGKYYKLCQPNFGKDLADMGQDLVRRLESPRIALSKRPQVSTLKVNYKGQPLKNGFPDQGGFWIYDFELNAVVFTDLSFAPSDIEQVEITYDEHP